MTKPSVESSKTRKSKTPSELRTNENNDSFEEEIPSTQIGEEVGEGSVSSVLTEDEDETEGASSGNDSDQVLASQLDVVLMQANESKIVVPPQLVDNTKIEPKLNQIGVKNDNIPKAKLELQEKDGSSSEASTKVEKAAGRKLEVERRRVRREKKLSKERRDRIKARVASQLLALTASSSNDQNQNTQEVSTSKIPKLSAERVRQQQAVNQARNRIGLSSKYGSLSKLVELHRFLLKGNPFALIEPKQVYPYFNSVPGINSTQIQPLVRAWQEKATRILYQLLLIETKGDIARLKKRTCLFQAEPDLFVDAFLLKVDIGLESEPTSKTSPASSQAQINQDPIIDQSTNKQPLMESEQPPLKKNKKATSKNLN